MSDPKTKYMEFKRLHDRIEELENTAIAALGKAQLQADRIEELEAELKRARQSAYEKPRGVDLDGTHYTPWQQILLEDLTAAEQRIKELEKSYE